MQLSHDEINLYLDFYEVLLTQKQTEIMNAYYREDLSLSEIAENMQITRSAVSDTLKRVSKTMLDYEVKLELIKKYKMREACYKELDKYGNEEVKKVSEKLKESEIKNYE